MQQHYHHDRYHFQKHRHKRRPWQPLIELQPGQVAFRVVCHDSKIGGVIGHSGSVISQIRLETGCLVHCEEAVKGSEHRAIVVVGSASPERKIAVGEGEAEVSGAQEAVVRVLERMWQVDAKKGGGGGECEGYCGLLANTTQIGAVVGREGRNIKRIKRGSGAHIWILPAPLCACKEEQLIQITGSCVAVKKAVIDVSSCLQDCPPYEKDEEMGFTVAPVERRSGCSSLDPHAEFFPHLCSQLPTFPENISSPTDGDCKNPPMQQLQVSFRMLCSHGAAGSIIGKGGSVVRALQNQTGASIIFAPPITNSDDHHRVVTVSALENLESCHSPAQNALVLVFARSIEHHIEKARSSPLISGTSVTATLLLPSNMVFCLSGRGDEIDSEIIETTGADIQILQGDQFFDCASKNDVVVQRIILDYPGHRTIDRYLNVIPCNRVQSAHMITGEYKNVQNALFQVTSKLRDNLLPIEMLNELRAGSSYRRVSAGESLDSNQETTLERRVDQVRDPSSLLQLLQKSQRGQTTYITDNGSSSSTFGKVSELERALHFLLPREVLN